MKRALWKRCASVIAGEIEGEPYAHWASTEFPVTFERVFEGKELQVELNMLEHEEEYIHIGIAVDDGGLGAYWPVSTSVIIRKP